MEKIFIHTETENQKSPPNTLELALKISSWAEDKKAFNLRLYEVSESCSYTDYILICSGTSDRHVSAISEEIRISAKSLGRHTLGTEGKTQGHWVLLDFGDVVVHVFHEPVREYYELDRNWSESRVSTKDGSKMEDLLSISVSHRTATNAEQDDLI